MNLKKLKGLLIAVTCGLLLAAFFIGSEAHLKQAQINAETTARITSPPPIRNTQPEVRVTSPPPLSQSVNQGFSPAPVRNLPNNQVARVTSPPPLRGNQQVTQQAFNDNRIITYTPQGTKIMTYTTLGSTTNQPSQAVAGTTTTQPTGDLASLVVYYVNLERANQGLSALTVDAKMHPYTAIRAQEIAGFFSHTRPNGEGPFSLYFSGCMGENIGYYATTRAVTTDDIARILVRNFMNSPSHRAAILNSSYRYISIGIYKTNLMVEGHAVPATYCCQWFSAY